MEVEDINKIKESVMKIKQKAPKLLKKLKQFKGLLYIVNVLFYADW